jgi:hypothetical protein
MTRLSISLIVIIAAAIQAAAFCQDGPSKGREDPAKKAAEQDRSKPIALKSFFPEPGAVDPNMTSDEYREYGRSTLYDYINGGAEVYLDLGFIKVGALEYSVELGEETWFTLDVYDMGRPESAFGIYRLERYGDATAIDVGAEGHMDGGSLYFWSRRYYVKISADDDGEAVDGILEKMARTVHARIGDPGEFPADLTLFPTRFRVPAGEKYAARNLMGLKSLKGFSALFRNKEDELTLYACRYAGEKEAGEAEKAFLARLRGALQPAEGEMGSYFSDKYLGKGWLQRRGAFLAMAQGLSGDPEKDGWKLETIKAFHGRVREAFLKARTGDALDSLLRGGGDKK